MLRRRNLFSHGGFDPSKTNVCDVIFSNAAGKFKSAPGFDTSKWPAVGSGYTPIGIVVVPYSHGILKDGSGTVNQCGVMSLVKMSVNSPETGDADATNLQIGHTRSSTSSDGLGRVNSYNDEQMVSFASKSKWPTIDGVTAAYFPIQTTVGGPATYGGAGQVASPYADTTTLNTGGLNTAYYSTTRGEFVTTDTDGIVNTKIWIDKSNQTDWRTATAITDAQSAYPAEVCCARFHTVGTKAFKDCTTAELYEGTGFWYSPTWVETMYMAARAADIGQVLANISSVYSISTMSSVTNLPTRSTLAGYFRLSGGQINTGMAQTRMPAVAFMRL